MNDTATKTPAHLWIVGILAVLWDAIGAFDYSATQLQLESYMSQFSEAQLDYFYAFPAWVDGAWAVAVWGSLLGAFGLLLRRAWCVWLFGAAILGMIVTSVYNFALSGGAEIMGAEAAAFTVVIWLIALALFVYSLAMKKRGVLA